MGPLIHFDLKIDQGIDRESMDEPVHDGVGIGAVACEFLKSVLDLPIPAPFLLAVSAMQVRHRHLDASSMKQRRLAARRAVVLTPFYQRRRWFVAWEHVLRFYSCPSMRPGVIVLLHAGHRQP